MHVMQPILILLLVFGVVPNAFADNDTPHDQVSFQVEVDQEIDNDRVNVILQAYDENTDPAKLADQINQTMKWGLKTARQVQGIKVRTGSYQTYPVHSDKNKIQRWRGRQELLLEASEVGQLSTLVSTLQSRLQIQSMQFSVSPDARRKTQDVLITAVLNAFQSRADLIATGLDAKGYHIVNLSVQTMGQRTPMPVRMESMRSASSVRVASPAMEAGTSRVTVQADGTIELRR